MLRHWCCRVEPDARKRSAGLFLIGYSSMVVAFAGLVSLVVPG